jgi:hypothetical protein
MTENQTLGRSHDARVVECCLLADDQVLTDIYSIFLDHERDDTLPLSSLPLDLSNQRCSGEFHPCSKLFSATHESSAIVSKLVLVRSLDRVTYQMASRGESPQLLANADIIQALVVFHISANDDKGSVSDVLSDEATNDDGRGVGSGLELDDSEATYKYLGGHFNGVTGQDVAAFPLRGSRISGFPQTRELGRAYRT